MKQFSDLQAIDTKINIDIMLTAITQNGNPEIAVTVNDQTLFDKSLQGTILLSYQVPILSPMFFCLELKNKQYNQNLETALIIDRISVDNIDIMPTYSYLADYQNDHNNNNPTNYLGFNGKWTLTIDRPFYQWLHQAQGQGWLLS
jgi:hypothetical protein